MKNIILFLITIVSTVALAQGTVPEGWDKIYFEEEVAYMNTETGEISKTLPRGYAKAKAKVVTNTYEETDGSGTNSFHTVTKGDTFSRIARKYNMSLSELYNLNNVADFDKLEIGQEVVVNGESNANSEEEFHIVKSKETLFRISQNYGVSIDKLKSLNSLDSNFISVGQRLNIR